MAILKLDFVLTNILYRVIQPIIPVYLKTSGPLVPPVHFSIGPSSSRHLPHTCTSGSSQKQSILGRSPASDCGALQQLQTSFVPTGEQRK